ncbi:MAG: transposase, partial [Clostridia bacterium]|nr:transposase [Clostridia bacterium]
EAMTTKEGILLRINRSIQVEGAFGVLKEDYGFKRFLTRGKQSIETQFFLLAFAFNIEKLCNRTKKERRGQHLFCLEEN